MRVKQVKIENFRAYHDQVVIDFNDLTAFVGKNDVGKSTILDALDIFFNEGNGAVKIDPGDVNKHGLATNNEDVTISVVFEDLPDTLIIDSSNETSLDTEYLLINGNQLEVVKKYLGGKKEMVFIKANHPTNPQCSGLLLKKQADLRKILASEGIEEGVDKNRNAEMRTAIWNHFENELQLKDIEIDVAKEDAKNIWTKLKELLPLYALFQSDRKNSDGDSEVQDPMKFAVDEILKNADIQKTLDAVAVKVHKKLTEVSTETLEKLKEMDPNVAKGLNPKIPTSKDLDWKKVFVKVSISGDEDIPINKRGSGVKRLILLNFFRAEAERRQQKKTVPDIIYAIEEPETSQHPDHQRKLIEAFVALSNNQHTQIVLTTHSPAVVKMLNFENLVLIEGVSGKRKVLNIEEKELPYPSLNEVNYAAFDEAGQEYHNELYGYIEGRKLLSEFASGKSKIEYIMDDKTPDGVKWSVTLSGYIRHRIHHPENRHYKGTEIPSDELKQSIEEMRAFIRSQPSP